MKKKEIKAQQTLRKYRQPLSFQQRFKNKKGIVGKLGVLQLLGVHQPLNMNHEFVNNQQSKQFSKSKINSTIQHLKQRRRISNLQDGKSALNNSKILPNKTEKIIISKNISKRKGSQLPKISKSSTHIQMADYIMKQDLSTRQYWKGKVTPLIVKKRTNSQLSCMNMVKNDVQANSHWKNLEKIQILNRISNKKGFLKLSPHQQ